MAAIKESVSLMAAINSWRGQATQVCREQQQSSLGKRVKQSSLGQDGQAIKSWRGQAIKVCQDWQHPKSTDYKIGACKSISWHASAGVSRQ
jgi:hypothetical protein